MRRDHDRSPSCSCSGSGLCCRTTPVVWVLWKCPWTYAYRVCAGARAACGGVLCITVILDSVGHLSIWLCCCLAERSSVLCLGTRGGCPPCLGGVGGQAGGSFGVIVSPAPC